MPPVRCWRGVWSNAAFAACRSCTADGTNRKSPERDPRQCMDIDQASAALIEDLRQRGLLDETLVVWGGEFGRTVYSQGTLKRDDYGRDHHPKNFCMGWPAAASRAAPCTGRPTTSATTPWRIRSTSTISTPPSCCLGIDHRRFTFKSQGLDQRLTGVENQRPPSHPGVTISVLKRDPPAT